MLRLTHLISLFCLLSCSSASPDPTVPSPTNGPPNILLIIADDMGVDATPNYPIATIKPNMPHLQSLMDRGLTFDNVWAFPQCSPTRSSILTGKYPVRTGVLNATDSHRIDASEQTIQAYLDAQLGKVYAHSIIGKWHLSNNEPTRPTDMGADHYAGLLGGGVSSYSEWALTQEGQTADNDEYISQKISDLAIDWIGAQDKPWFCWLAYTTPHTPFHLPPAGTHSQGDLPVDDASIAANPEPYFMAMLENLDYEMGRVINSIPSGELENTVIIFLGDNGTAAQVIQSPYDRTRAKGSIYQGGIHVPMVVSGTGVSRQGDRDDNLISSTDLFSTIGQIAGIDQSQYEDSYSIYELLDNNVEGNRQYNYSEVLNVDRPAKSGYTIRNARYKLVVLDNGATRLYDLENDPYETENRMRNELTVSEQAAYDELMAKVTEIRS